MLVKIFSLSFNSINGGFDDGVLRDFIKDVEVLSIENHFFVRNEVPYLALIVKYFPHRPEIQTKENKDLSKSKPEEAWKQTLSESDMGLFNLLRDWRHQRAKKDGVPPYVIFTNNQLAQVVKTRPQSLAELTQIDGIGPNKSKRYGEEILKISKIDIAPAQISLGDLQVANPS